MPARLILNADDFGLTPGINRAIAELHQAGTLTSATLMASGVAFRDAVDLAHANPSLGIGCHVVLTDGIPLSPPESIPTLLGSDRKHFRSSLPSFAQAALLGRLNPDEIEREALAQIHKIQDAGIRVTHLDTHKHTHIFPAITGPLMNAAVRASIPALRNPFEAPWSTHVSKAPLLRLTQMRLLNRLRPGFLRLTTNMQTPDAALGIASTGTLDASTLELLLTQLPTSGTFELVCHPGYNDSALQATPTRLLRSREIEYRALLQLLPIIKSLPRAPELIHYGSIANSAPSAS